MSNASTFIAERLGPALWRGLALVGVLALLVAVTSAPSTPATAGLFNAHHFGVLSDCQPGGGDGCASHGSGPSCNLHSGCATTGVLPTGPVVSAAPCRDRAMPSHASIAGWADFPDKPPPISRS